MTQARLASQRGLATAGSIAVLGVMLVIAGSVFAQVVHISGTSNRDDSSKRAFQAAEAGMSIALHRLNMLQPAPSLCITQDLASPDASGWCAVSEEESLGRGQTFRYRVSASPAGTECAGTSLGSTVVDRCVIAVGRVAGEARRVEMRVSAYAGEPLFGSGSGLLALEGVTIGNSSTITGGIASNGGIVVGGGQSSVTGNVQVGPTAPDPSGVGAWDRRDAPFVLAPAEFGNTATQNDNYRISNGLQSPPVEPYDSSSRVTYDSATRALNVGTSGSITLGGGTYNFCSVTLGNQASIVIAAGAVVRIYLDSPDRDGSGCPEGSGTLTSGNNSLFASAASGDPAALQIYVWGDRDEEHVLDLPNRDRFNAAVYAPNSTVRFKNSGTVAGGISARRIEFKNSSRFDWDADLASFRATTVLVHYRTAWRECRALGASADPSAPC